MTEAALHAVIASHGSDINGRCGMAAITVRNLPEATHRALKARAAAHGRSAEAEVRAILQDAVTEPGDLGFGSRINQAAVEAGGFDLEVSRDATISDPLDFA